MTSTETHECAAAADLAAKPRAKRVQLTPEQQQLAEQHVPLARSLARPMKATWPNYKEEFDSAALLALVEAAQSFEPGRNVKFTTFARFRILGSLRDFQRRLVTKGFEKELPNVPKVFRFVPGVEEGSQLMLTTPDVAACHLVDSTEEVEHWVSKLPPRHAEACREMYLRDRSQADVARTVGCSKSRVSYLHAEALSMLGHMGEVRLAALEMGLSGCLD